jgi:hypothetical protein
MAGDIDPGVAAAVGTALATIHSRSAGDPTIAVAFNNDDTFEAIRLEPYLRATAQRHPDLAHVLQKLADTTAATKLALVHGDVSPKNILVGPNGPVFLDAECAWVRRPRLRPGILPQPPALKGAWRPELRDEYLSGFNSLAGAYLSGVDWEPPDQAEGRCAHLLPGLFLARVDGKSPVEYLADEAAREQVRKLAREFLHRPTERLDAIAQSWRAAG